MVDIHGEDILCLILTYIMLEDYIILRKKVEEQKNISKEVYIPITALFDCSHKFYLSTRSPLFTLFAQPVIFSPESNPLLLGKLVHKGLQAYLKEALEFLRTDNELKYLLGKFNLSDIKKVLDEYWIKKTFTVNINKNGTPTTVEAVLVGRADVYVEDTVRLVFEIKSTQNPKNLPKPHHVLQLRTYLNLLNADKGQLVYFTPSNFYYFNIDDPLTDEEVKEYIIRLLEDRNIVRSYCKYCMFNRLCKYSSHTQEEPVFKEFIKKHNNHKHVKLN